MQQGPLEARLKAFVASAAFTDPLKARSAKARETRITHWQTQWLLAELARQLAPANCLEIGTFFADTTRIIADALCEQGGGDLVTIDPFGGDRVPGIMAGWPAAQQAATSFKPQNSMSFFLDLELARAPRGQNAPFNLVFVDGHHSFDYAFFDLLRSAHYLRPGGAIVVDNTEQSGPAQAVGAFLERYRHWTFFCQADYRPPVDRPEFMADVCSAVLLAPDGIEIGPLPYKFNLYDIDCDQIAKIRMAARNKNLSGTLIVSANMYSMPYDHHETGKGLSWDERTSRHALTEPSGPLIEVCYETPLRVTRANAEAPVHLELELRFLADSSDGQHVLLHPAQPEILPT